MVAVFLLILVEDCGIPIPVPGNIILLYLGFRISRGQGDWLSILATATLATWLGSLVLYYVAYRIGRPALIKFGVYVGLEPKRIARIERWLGRYGSVAVLLGRGCPGLRNPTSAISGTFGVSRATFALFSAISSLAWTGGWLYAGSFFGRWVRVDVDNISVSHLAAGMVFFALLFFALPGIGAVNYWRKSRRASATSGANHVEGKVADSEKEKQANRVLTSSSR